MFAQRPELPCFLLRKHSETIYCLHWVMQHIKNNVTLLLLLQFMYLLICNALYGILRTRLVINYCQAMPMTEQN